MIRAGTLTMAFLVLATLLTSCGSSRGEVNAAAAAPPQAKVEEVPDLSVVKVDRPERFSLIAAGQEEDRPQLDVNGVISPDIDFSVPVISLASGRVVEIHAKLGDDVRKGQLLLKVSSDDVSAAFATYNQAVADESLAKKQFDRAQLLYEHGANSQNDVEVATDAQAKAEAALAAAAQRIRTLGGDLNRPDPVVAINAPISGTIVEQNVVLSSSVHTPDNQSNLFTIANLSNVWALCDVYENDLPAVQLGEIADVRLNAYQDRVFHGRISNISKVLDPNLRTVKVRIQLANPGIMRSGMFLTATFFGRHGRAYATVPAGAILHLHDRDWVFVPAGSGQFRRVEVVGGKIANGRQEIVSGLAPGQQIVMDALALDAESQQ